MASDDSPDPSRAFITKVAVLARWQCAEHRITHPGDIAARVAMIAEVLADSEQYDREELTDRPDRT